MAPFSALADRITCVGAARRNTSAAYNEGFWVAVYWFYMTEVSTVMWASGCCLSLEFPCGICRNGVNRGGRLQGGESGQQIGSKNIFSKNGHCPYKECMLQPQLNVRMSRVDISEIPSRNKFEKPHLGPHWIFQFMVSGIQKCELMIKFLVTNL